MFEIMKEAAETCFRACFLFLFAGGFRYFRYCNYDNILTRKGSEKGKWEGKQKGKSDKRITESKARQKESTTFCTNLAD
jgi:hypothetical protein